MVLKNIKLVFPVAFFFASIFLSPFLLHAQTVYVKKHKTKITEAPSSKSKIIAVINTGIALKIIDKKGKFIYVKLPDGKKGWVFKFKVTNKKPVMEKKGDDMFALLGGEREITANEGATGGSIRGLNKISERYAKNEGIKQEHVQAVKNMENFRVPPKELELFMTEGRLGEYTENQ